MKIYTKGGDKGETSLLGGTRVPKNHIRLQAFGALDELNANLGLLRDMTESREKREALLRIQNNIFVLASFLASENDRARSYVPDFDEDEITFLEKEIDRMESNLTTLKFFIIPGGHPLVSHCHICRTVCRRAEREIINLSFEQDVYPKLIEYINRLSDFLFVLARSNARDMSVGEIAWKGNK